VIEIQHQVKKIRDGLAKLEALIYAHRERHQLNGGDPLELDATQIISGTFDVARIPDLDASKIVSGVFDVARIPDLDASKITSGVFDVDRIPDLDASKITSGVFDIARIPDIPRSKIPDFFSSPFWDNIPDKPSTFPPSVHAYEAHGYRIIRMVSAEPSNPSEGWIWYRTDIDELRLYTTEAKTVFPPQWGDIVGVPSAFPPEAHASTHNPGGSDELAWQSLSTHLIPSDDKTYDLGSSTKRWRDAYLTGQLILSCPYLLPAGGPLLKLENTSTETDYPRLEIKNPARNWRFKTPTNTAALELWDATGGIKRVLISHSTGPDTVQFMFADSDGDARYHIMYSTSADSHQHKWLVTGGALAMYLDYEGDLFVDGTYNTFSPEIPETVEEAIEIIKRETSKQHPPRDEDGNIICICGKKLSECGKHNTAMAEKYAVNHSKLLMALAKVVLSLLERK